MNLQYFITYPKRSVIKTTGGTLISEIQNKYTLFPNGKRFYLQPTEEKTIDYLTGITTTISYSRYDADNNPQTIQTRYANDLIETQEIKYTRSGAWCYNKISEEIITQSRHNETDHVRIKRYTYDNKGNLLTQTNDPGTAFQKTLTYGNYDQYGNPRLTVVQAGNESRSSSSTYSSNGRFITSKTNHWLNETINYTYDETKGLLLNETSRFGTTTYKYDSFGRLIKTIGLDKKESVSLWKWNDGTGPANAVYYKYTEDSGQSPSTTWYDKQGREIRKEFFGLKARKIFIDTEYNSKNQVYRISEPYFENDTPVWDQIYTYDPFGRITTTVMQLGTTTYSYSGLTTQANTPNENTKTIKNAVGETVAQTTNGKTVNFTFYASGLIKSATPEGGLSVQMEYDLIGNRTKLTDPDAGIITSTYDSWGQLIRETQYVHSTTTPVITNYVYQNGLLTNISRNGEITNYEYDANKRIKNISIAGKHTQHFEYDRFDRMIKLTETIENDKTLTKEITYNSFGQVEKETYPSGYHIIKHYDTYGYLTDITDTKGNLCWQALQGNAKGQITKSKQGNKETTFTYDDRGFPTSITAGNIINMTYSFNEKGNLAYREDMLSSQKETFVYDNMNRLTNWSVARNGVIKKDYSISYNPSVGTISTKSDIGYTMNYGENGKLHALTSINGLPQSIPTWSQNITYTDFKKIKTINDRTLALNLTYGVDKERRKTVFTDRTYSLTRYYFGNYEEEINNEGKIRKIHYIAGTTGPGAIFVQNDGKDSLYYLYTDYQSSILAVTDQNGNVKERYAYDPWGKRRNPSYWEEPNNCPYRTMIVNRGYTMHEHLDEFNLINMGGRVYDPLLGMFLSPDPFIQAPNNWLNYNRYSYCFNNTFTYIDPNGEIAWFVPVIIGAVIGTYSGGVIANEGQFNPTKWDYKNIKTWGFMLGGAAIGGVSGLAGGAIAGSNIPMANTAAIAGSSLINSVGTYIYTGGKTPISINFGIASYDFINNEWGYLGEKNNKWYQNMAYSFGALANLSDAISLFGGGTEYDVNASEIKSEWWGHSSGTGDNINISVGPGSNNHLSKMDYFKTIKGKKWHNYAKSEGTWTTKLNNVNQKILQKMPQNIENGKGLFWGDLKWNLIGYSCVNHVSRSLWGVGIPTLPINLHPYILNAQLSIRQLGIYSSPYLYNFNY